MSAYWPLEFFLSEVVQEEHLITWIVDRVSILRAVFEAGSWPLNETPLQEHQAVVQASEKAIHTVVLDEQAICLYLPDGTATIFLNDDDMLQAYQFTFEDSSS